MHKLKHLAREYSHLLTVNNAVLGIAVLIALGWVWGSVDALQRNYMYQQQVDSQKADVEVLGLEADNLQAEQAYLNSNEYLELAARDKFNKSLPGEKELILPAATKSAATVIPTLPSASPSNLSQWMNFLFGKQTS